MTDNTNALETTFKIWNSALISSEWSVKKRTYCKRETDFFLENIRQLTHMI